MGARGSLGRSSAWVFCGLILIVSGERRLADHVHNRYLLAHTELTLQNAEALDGDEIALRLIAIDDAIAAPRPAAPAPARPRAVIRRADAAVSLLAVALPPLRAPPAPARRASLA